MTGVVVPMQLVWDLREQGDVWGIVFASVRTCLKGGMRDFLGCAGVTTKVWDVILRGEL